MECSKCKKEIEVVEIDMYEFIFCDECEPKLYDLVSNWVKEKGDEQ